jgi:hypothetical protein
VEGKHEIAAAIEGGHGELFVQQFDGSSVRPVGPLLNLPASEAASAISAEVVVGSGARRLVDARGWGEAREGWPCASNLTRLPQEMRMLPPKPVYARAPDARAKEAA